MPHLYMRGWGRGQGGPWVTPARALVFLNML